MGKFKLIKYEGGFALLDTGYSCLEFDAAGFAALTALIEAAKTARHEVVVEFGDDTRVTTMDPCCPERSGAW